MVRRKTFSLNPPVLAAIICAFAIYAFKYSVRAKCNFFSLANYEDITFVSGKFASGAVKNSSGNYYSGTISVDRVAFSDGSEFQAKGNISVLIPQNYAEAYYPGKIYTKSKQNAVICEQGESVNFSGCFNKDFFIVKNAYDKSLENNSPGCTTIIQKLFKLRTRSRINFRRLMYSWGNAGGLLLALLSGIREYTESSVGEAFRKSGLSHILALSGMHLSLFSGLFKKTERFVGNKISSLFQIFAVFSFVWFAGISASLFRAMLCSLMQAFMSFLKIKKINLLSVLGISFLIHIVVRSEDIYSLSFILSYGALAGILLFGNFCSVFNAFGLPYIISSSLGASAGAQFLTAPVSLKYFNAFSPIGIISTVVVSPLISLFIYSGLFCIFLCLVFPVFVPFSSFLLNIQYNVIKQLVLEFSAFPVFSIAG